MNSNASRKNKVRPWWTDFSFEFSMLILICLFMIALTIMVGFVVAKAHAGGCLFIDVPPQAVVNQPDGDTFHVFSFQPGGLIKIRVEGVNTPETSKKKGVPDEPGSLEAKAFTKDWLAKGPFRVTTCGKPTLDRIRGTVERNGQSLAHDLKAAGLGR